MREMVICSYSLRTEDIKYEIKWDSNYSTFKEVTGFEVGNL